LLSLTKNISHDKHDFAHIDENHLNTHFTRPASSAKLLLSTVSELSICHPLFFLITMMIVMFGKFSSREWLLSESDKFSWNQEIRIFLRTLALLTVYGFFYMAVIWSSLILVFDSLERSVTTSKILKSAKKLYNEKLKNFLLAFTVVIISISFGKGFIIIIGRHFQSDYDDYLFFSRTKEMMHNIYDLSNLSYIINLWNTLSLKSTFNSLFSTIKWFYNQLLLAKKLIFNFFTISRFLQEKTFLIEECSDTVSEKLDVDVLSFFVNGFKWLFSGAFLMGKVLLQQSFFIFFETFFFGMYYCLRFMYNIMSDSGESWPRISIDMTRTCMVYTATYCVIFSTSLLFVVLPHKQQTSSDSVTPTDDVESLNGSFATVGLSTITPSIVKKDDLRASPASPNNIQLGAIEEDNHLSDQIHSSSETGKHAKKKLLSNSSSNSFEKILLRKRTEGVGMLLSKRKKKNILHESDMSNISISSINIPSNKD